MDRFGYTTFCDDIRNEVGGKLSFIGCYNAVMFVSPPFPITLPKLCAHFHIWTSDSRPFRSVLARYYLPHEPFPVVEEQLEIPNVGHQDRLVKSLEDRYDAPRFIVVSTSIILAPAVISGPGLIRVRAIVDHEPEEMSLGSLQVVTTS